VDRWTGGSMETHCKGCPWQGRHLLPSDMACWQGFHDRHVCVDYTLNNPDIISETTLQNLNSGYD
jgi:hypothetical protein